MASKDAPTPDIMNVKELIEFAFGDFEKNTVNFKLVQTVLFLIARQLRLLERRVIVETGPITIFPSDTTLSVTEVKIHAAQKTQAKTGGAKHGAAGRKSEGEAIAGVGTGDGTKGKKRGRDTPSDKTSIDKRTFADKTNRGKTTSSGEKTSTDRTTSSVEKTYTDRTSLSDEKPSLDKRTSSGEKSSTDRRTSSGEKTYTDKIPESDGQTFTDRTTSSSEKTSTDKKTTAPGGKYATDKTSASDGKTSTDRTTSAGEKTSTDKTTSPGGKKTTAPGEKYATDKTSASDGKTSTDRTTSAGEKTSTDKTTTPGGKTSTDRTTSSGDKTSSYKTVASAGKTSTGRTTSSGKKTFTDETTSISTDKPSSKTTLSDRTSTSRTTLSSKDAARRKKPDSYPDTLDTLEEQRERELRIIHQRTDSFEETIKTPTPMASVSSMQYEKLLVVKKVPSSDTRLGESMQRRSPQISVVTQEQFQQVADAVRHLEKKLLPVGTPGFLEHAELMEELRRGASLTDAMAALQLSARLEATEKALTYLTSMVTDLALKTPGVEIDTNILDDKDDDNGNDSPRSEENEYLSQTGEVLGISTVRPRDSGTPEPGEVIEGDRIESDRIESDRIESDRIEGDPSKDDRFKGDPFEVDRFPDDPFEGGRSATTTTDAKGSKSVTDPTDTAIASSETAEIEMTQGLNTASGAIHVGGPSPAPAPEAAHTELEQSRFIIHADLKRGSSEMYDDMITKLKVMTTRTSTTAENAYKLALNLERRLQSALLDTSRMVDLENTVKQYAEQINALDTGLSSQMTNYQEQLTQMQHDLEIALDTMAEVLGNSGGDTEAVAELHSHFTNLQMDFETITFRQQELKSAQNSTAYDLENLWREIEMLRDTKSDREEVADALRDKAGISELNRLVSVLQFEAVRGDFQKRIHAAYDKFNNQEIIWQKAIDDTVKVLNEKADLVQLYSLKDEIDKYLIRIKERMQIILDVVGEPKSAMLSKKVFRDTLCLSCGSPAHMDVEEMVKVPALPKFPSARQPAEGAEAESETKGGGDYGACYPGLPIPHPRDPRSHICKRYCGGSHTVVTDGLNRALPGLVVQQARRQSNAEPGTDGKLYLMDVETKKIPCLPCNVAQLLPTDPEPEPQKQAPMDSIDEIENISLTPPAHEISNN